MIKKMKEASKAFPIGDLPEGIFGLIDDVSIKIKRKPKKTSKLKPSLQFKPTKIKKKAKKSSLDGIELAALEIKKDSYEDKLPDLPYENVVKISEELLAKVKRKTDIRSKELSKLMLERMLPTVLGFDAAQNYVTSSMRDGLNIDIDIDESVLEVAKNVISIDMAHYFLSKSSLPKDMKRYYLRSLIKKSAETSIEQMAAFAKSKESTKKYSDLQSMIVKGMSKRPQGINPNVSKNERPNKGSKVHDEETKTFIREINGDFNRKAPSFFEDVDGQASKKSNIGLLRRTRR